MRARNESSDIKEFDRDVSLALVARPIVWRAFRLDVETTASTRDAQVSDGAIGVDSCESIVVDESPWM
jgi:hypothetical protein